MSPNSPTNVSAVIGNPISHSRSPQIHQWFAKQFALNLNYARIQAEDETFTQTVTDFFGSGGRGLNITTPFKQQAFELADVKHRAAQEANSGNTLWLDNNKLQVTSTDGDGWYEHIQYLGLDLSTKKILILGAGGAGRVILAYLRSLNTAEQIYIANRSQAKLNTLALGGSVRGCTLDAIPEMEFDLIINALPTGWQNTFPELTLPITEQTQAYDLNYGDGAQAFMQWFLAAGGQNKQFYDGWGMLVCQAALSFEIWWGLKPDIIPLIENPNLID